MIPYSPVRLHLINLAASHRNCALDPYQFVPLFFVLFEIFLLKC